MTEIAMEIIEKGCCQHVYSYLYVSFQIDNMKLAFKLLEDAGLPQNRVNPLGEW